MKKLLLMGLISVFAFGEIKYHKGFSAYALNQTDVEAYKDFVDVHKIDPLLLETIFEDMKHPKAEMLSAIAYDYVYKRPDLAEPLYEKNSKRHGFDFHMKYIDFLMRTGRPSKILKELKKTDCMSNIKRGPECHYYRGVSEFLTTGVKTQELRIAKDYYPKAMELWKR